MLHKLLRAALVVALAAATTSEAHAQLFGPGLTWSSDSGSSAGSFVFDCTPRDVAVAAGDTVTITAWGDVGSPFALLFAPSASSCLPLTGIEGALVLDFPVLLAGVGVLNDVTPCLSCPQGIAELSLTLGGGFPPGASFSIQDLGFGAGDLAFSVAITATFE